MARFRSTSCVTRITLAGMLAATTLILTAPATLAAEAQGCSGSAESLNQAGKPISVAAAPGVGGTADNPLVIDPQGQVTWEGKTANPITDGTWSVSAMGVTILRGNATNPDATTMATGTMELSSTLAPVQWALTGSALIPVSGSMSGSGGSCTASGFVRGSGSAVSSPIFIAGVVLAILGLLLGVSVAVSTTVKGGTP